MKLAQLLLEDEEEHYRAAVAIVGDRRRRWLLGLSTADDSRKGTWCYPGGKLNGREEPRRAAARECREETGVRCSPVGPIHTLSSKPGVAFVRCRANSSKLKPNSEFAALGWFTRREMKALKLFPNVLRLLDKVT